MCFSSETSISVNLASLRFAQKRPGRLQNGVEVYSIRMEKQEVCEHFLNVSNNSYFHIVLCVQIIFCFVGIVFQVPLWVAARRSEMIHKNTKILLAYHQLGVVMHCAAKLALHINDLFVFLFVSSSSRCDYIPTNLRCFAFRLPITFGMHLTIFASAAVMVERFVATKQLKVYERYGSTLGNWLGVTQLICCVLAMVLMSYDEDFSANNLRSYCTTSDNNNKQRVLVVLIFDVIVELVNVVIFPILFFVNKNLRKAGNQQSLSANYQLTENIRSITVLTPFAVTQLIFVTFYVVAVFFYTTISARLSPEFYPAYLESVSLIPIYAVILPAITWFSHRKYRLQSLNRLNKGMQSQDINDYFKTLQNKWQSKTYKGTFPSVNHRSG
ncbi:hypothetical protein L596_023654 [Steinernema carpocapsae]|uniref:G-protein coupled receptors family 1 profile domain-containing protein n=1 Tax=Steinernema carpocapsae TaxID=34508 RepID=A0A4U5ME97_STECR|nr:hypothetical protein L596_023654 [Steinernema carpocapsae]